MNSVREITGPASGCWARAPIARETAQPSPMAVIGAPMPTVAPAMMIEIMPISSRLSTDGFSFFVGRPLELFLVGAGGRGDVDQRQDREDVGLDHADQQAQHVHDDGKEQRRD